MRIVTLIENTTCREDLAAEHGLSLYIETGGHRILFDAGQSGAFADNARKLGVDLGRVDFAVLSHGHYDHGGGLARFLERNETAPVYLSRHAFGAHHNARGDYIGLDPRLAESGRLVLVDGDLEIAPGITLCAGCDRPGTAEPFGLTVRRGNVFYPERFLHEQYLLIRENGRRFCISGCSHRGIGNIVRWFRPDVLVGGFHFMKLDPHSPDLRRAAAELMGYATRCYTGHCTGIDQYAALKAIMGSRLGCLTTGAELTIGGESRYDHGQREEFDHGTQIHERE